MSMANHLIEWWSLLSQHLKLNKCSYLDCSLHGLQIRRIFSLSPCFWGCVSRETLSIWANKLFQQHSKGSLYSSKYQLAASVIQTCSNWLLPPCCLLSEPLLHLFYSIVSARHVTVQLWSCFILTKLLSQSANLETKFTCVWNHIKYCLYNTYILLFPQPDQHPRAGFCMNHW